MKIPDALRRPFYNKSEIQRSPIPQNIKIRPEEQENGETSIKPDTEKHTTPVGFFHPSLRKVRNRAVAKWIITTAFLMAFILAVLSVYWGVFFGVQNRLHNLRVLVVDMDGAAPYDTSGSPFVGPAITQLVRRQLSASTPTLGWDIRSGDEYGNDPVNVRQAVYDMHAWAAIVVNANASALLRSAVATGNASYQPLGAMQLVYQDARDDTNWYDFMLPIISAFMTQAQSEVGMMWAGMLVQEASGDAGLLGRLGSVPQAVNPAVGFSEFNLRPFFPYTGIPAVSIGLIYLIIISFFSFSFYMPIHMQYLSPQGHPPLKFPQLIAWRWLTTLAAYLCLSLAYSFVSLSFQINFTHTNPITSQTQPTDIAYGNPVSYAHGTFPVYWMLNFLGMAALGFACENVAMVIGMPWMGLFLILWVITNVSTGFYDIEIAPGFYRWGYAWPLHSIVEGSRSMLFGLHSRIGVDFGILAGWVVGNSVLFPGACWVQRWKSQRGVHEYWPMD